MSNSRPRAILGLALLLVILLPLACGDKATDPPQDPAPTFNDGMVTNGSAEIGDGAPDNWAGRIISGPTYSHLWAEEGSAGGRSLAITAVSNPTESAFAFWVQTLTSGIPVGRDVTLHAKVKVSDVRWTGAIIALRGDTESPPTDPAEQFVTTQGVEHITGTADWASYEVTMPRVGAEIRTLSIFLILRAVDGTAWFDEVSLFASFPAPAGAELNSTPSPPAASAAP